MQEEGVEEDCEVVEEEGGGGGGAGETSKSIRVVW